MRKTIRFLHTMAAIGFIGALAGLAVLHTTLPEPAELERFAVLRTAQGAVVSWLLLPSMGLVLVSGLLSRAALEGEVPVGELGLTVQPEWASFWIIGAVAVVNVALGVWRPSVGGWASAFSR